MSDFHVVVVEINNVGKHPNADTLSLCHVNGNYQVIFRTEDFKEGDKAVYITPDALVPVSNPLFAFLEKDAKEGYARIKAKKLRQIFSHGMLVACTDPTWEVGRDVRTELGVDKYEPQTRAAMHGLCASPPKRNWPTYDLESYRKYANVFEPEEHVVITEKIHGCNARYSYQDGKLHIGSHKVWKDSNFANIWVRVAAQYDLQSRLAEFPGYTVYGEIFGWVQDLKYGAGVNQIFFRVFDVRDPDGKWLDWDRVVSFCEATDLHTVPTLFEGPWADSLLSLADGNTEVGYGANNIREGIVIKTAKERFCVVGRACLKYVSEAYLTRKEGAVPIMEVESVPEIPQIDHEGLLKRIAEAYFKDDPDPAEIFDITQIVMNDYYDQMQARKKALGG